MTMKEPDGFLDYFDDLEDPPRIDRKKLYSMDVDGGHGRIETRQCMV